jgi:hypothetical protein
MPSFLRSTFSSWLSLGRLSARWRARSAGSSPTVWAHKHHVEGEEAAGSAARQGEEQQAGKERHQHEIDHLGGVRVTLVNFVLMALFTGLLFLTLPGSGSGSFLTSVTRTPPRRSEMIPPNERASAPINGPKKASLRSPHMWLLSLLYLATFGSFIGFSAGFAMLAKTQFRTGDVIHTEPGGSGGEQQERHPDERRIAQGYRCLAIWGSA